MKLEAEETIQFEGIKPAFWFVSDSCVKTKHMDVVGPKWYLVGSEGLARVKPLCGL